METVGNVTCEPMVFVTHQTACCVCGTAMMLQGGLYVRDATPLCVDCHTRGILWAARQALKEEQG